MARNEKNEPTPAQRRAQEKAVRKAMGSKADRDRDWEGTESVFDVTVQFGDNPEDRD